MKRKFLRALMAAMALTLLFSGMGQADIVLSGTNLVVGINAAGGMVNLTATQGITYVPSPFSNDYTYPGIPWEYWVIGVDGVASTAYGVPGGDSNPGGLVTDDLSSGTTLQGHTDGPQFLVNGANIIYHQVITFDMAEKTIHVSADIFNNNPYTLTNVAYARGMDPDQDVLAFGDFRTVNTISGDSVTAVGPNTLLYVIMKDNTVDLAGIASVSGPLGGPWETDPYNLGAGGFLNGATGGYEDASINMVWLIGDMPAFTSKQIDFEYSFGVVPVPPSLILLGSGLLGLLAVRFRRNRA
jgi:hypothetical protein